jgi:hypothetical protein
VPYLGEIERGKKYPSAPVLERLAALEVPVADRLERTAAALRGVTPPRHLEAIGFPLPVRTGSPRALVEQVVELLAPDDVAMLGALLAARRQRARAEDAESGRNGPG